MHPCTYVTLRRNRGQIRPVKSISNKGLKDMEVMAVSGDNREKKLPKLEARPSKKEEEVGNKS